LKSTIFCLARDSGADGSLSGFDWWYFQHSHKPRFFAFGKAPRVAPFCFRMSGESKDFDYPIPGNVLPKHLNHWDRFDVLGFAAVYCLNRIS
jgi:hypothetical protein